MGDLQKQFGKRLKLLRKAKKITQEQIASLAKMDWKYYGLIERGEMNSTLETIEKLATAFNVEVYQLFIFINDGLIEEDEIIEEEVQALLSKADKKSKKKILKIAQLVISDS